MVEAWMHQVATTTARLVTTTVTERLLLHHLRNLLINLPHKEEMSLFAM
jgi:hypothetical protein